jgi:hypothetical protein
VIVAAVGWFSPWIGGLPLPHATPRNYRSGHHSLVTLGDVVMLPTIVGDVV